MAYRPQAEIDAARAAWWEGVADVYHGTAEETQARHDGFDSGYVMGEDRGFTRGWKAAEEYCEELKTAPPEPPSEWQKVGRVVVDSGTLVVVDPCYVASDMSFHVTMDELVGTYSTPADWQPQQVKIPDTEQLLVRLSNFGDDGTYDVLVKRGSKGNVRAALIVFDEQVFEHDLGV